MRTMWRILLLTVCMVMLGTAVQAETVPTGVFPGTFADPVVLLDEDRANQKTGDRFSVCMTLTGADYLSLYLTIENREGEDIRVVASYCAINGIMLDEYSEWTVPGYSTAEVGIDMPSKPLRWIGSDRIETLAFERIQVYLADDIYGEGYTLIKDRPTYTINPPSEKEAQGYVLWESELGRLTLLGVDYSDSARPCLMLQLDNNQPNIIPDWLPNYSQPQYMGVQIAVISVNGIEPGRSRAELSLREMGSALDGCAVYEFDLEDPQPGELGYVPVGELQEITLRITVTADGMGNQPYEEVITLQIDDLKLPQYGTPFSYEENSTGLTLRPEWVAYYQRLREQ